MIVAPPSVPSSWGRASLTSLKDISIKGLYKYKGAIHLHPEG
ncbi:hypothetical protein [Sulfurisphaera ohwakuensis]|nr:hypothetical protein [Sulfurisphaera ohwakuensis]